MKDYSTVSWHADSSLEHFSSIGVYHVSMDNDEGGKDAPDGNDGDWRVSLRVRHDSEGPGAGKFNHPSKPTAVAMSDSAAPTAGCSEEDKHPELVMTPPVAVPLPKRCCYYMIDDFNHHHQHSVLVGNSHRFASTHRVCKRDGHTFSSIQGRCKGVLQVCGIKSSFATSAYSFSQN